MQLNDFKTPWGSTIKAYSREGTIDWNTLQSCIVEDEYRVARLPENGVAIDLGSYIGGCSLALASRGYKVFSAEPLLENNEVARKNIELNNFNIKIIEKAVTSESNKKVTISYADISTPLGKAHEFIGSIVPRFTPDIKDGDTKYVPTITLEDIFKENNIDRCNFLKVDIEGSEWDVFKNIPDYILDKIDRIAVEIDGTLEKPATTTNFLKLLHNKFYDASPEYFPDWHKPAQWVHGYFKNKNL